MERTDGTETDKPPPTPYNRRFYCGTKVITLGTTRQDFQLLGPQEIIDIANSMGNIDHANAPCVAVINGDYNALNTHILSALYQNGSIVCHMDRATTGNLRINYIIGFA